MRLRDALIPAALAAVGIVELVSLHMGRLPVGIAATAICCALLVFRRRWPLIAPVASVWVILALPVVAGTEMSDAATPILYIALATFTFARHLPWPTGAVGLGLVFTALVMIERLTTEGATLSDALFLVAILVPPYAFGLLTRRLADGHAEQTRLLRLQEESRRRAAVADERARIARELHDLLAHSISVMVVQAEVAADLMPAKPDRAAAALRDVTASGRAALDETGRLLRLIRNQDDTGTDGLAGLTALVDGFRRDGLRVDLTLQGSPDDLPGPVSVAGRRIVGELLTNALRHADDRAVRLCLDLTGPDLTIEAANRAGKDAGSGGFGLVEMRERAAVLGGTVRHGVDDGGTFRVVAVLPRDPAAPS
ncbi:histidine kinase [Actinoplanes sp. NPDC051633]|uniref:sensor histidine kinase n=1 Tax=Actinoplanes sp. NPDC051633 TaxID=3155670 RepID=UPI00343C70C7